MINKNNQNPRISEEKEVISSSRAGASKGHQIGALAGIIAGGAFPTRRGVVRRAINAGVGAVGGSLAGGSIGKRIGRKTGADDVRASRQALRQNMAALSDRLTELETSYSTNNRGWTTAVPTDRFGNTNESDRVTLRNWPIPRFPLKGITAGNSDCLGRDGEGEAKLSRQALASEYGWGIVGSLPDSMLTRAHCQKLRDQILMRGREGNGDVGKTAEFERKILISHLGEKVVSAMGNAEVHCHFLSAQRRGLIELSGGQETTDFDLRSRNPAGEYSNTPSPDAVRKAYDPRKRDNTTRNRVAAGGAIGVAGTLIGSALLKRKAKVPKLYRQTVDAPATSSNFGRRDFQLFVNDPNFPKTAEQPLPSPEDLAKHGLDPKSTRKQWLAATLKRLRAVTEWSARNRNVRQFASIGSEIASDAVEQLVKPSSSKKKKVVLDRNGNPINTTFLPDPGTRQTGQGSVANQGAGVSQFGIGSIGKVASTVGKHIPDFLTITAADAAADIAAGAALEGRPKKAKKKRTISQGIEPTPGAGTAPGATTSMSIREVLTEFAQGRERTAKQKRDNATAIGHAAVAGAGIGGVAGAIHRPGSPVSNNEIRPGDVLNRRSGPFGVYQHQGVVGRDGRVTHRTRGSEAIRSVSPQSFRKVGRGDTYRENPSGPFTAEQRAARASQARGTSAGKYHCIGNSCQTTATRIATGKGYSPQLRRAGIGAAVGGLTAGAIAAAIARKKKGNQ